MRSPKQRQKWAPFTKPYLPQNWIHLVLIFVCILRIHGRRHPCQPIHNKIQCENSPQSPFSFLWKVRRDPPAFFFGTIHVPYSKVWDSVPTRAKSAFRSSQRIVFELDLLNEATYESLAKCQYLPQNEALSDVIPSEMFNRLRRHLQWVRHQIPHWLTDGQRARGLVAEQLYSLRTANWEKKRPIWAMLMINALTESDVRSHGVPVLDSYLAQEAIRMDKKIGSVEHVDEQCAPLNALNKTQVLFALNQTLLQHEAIRHGTAKPQVTTDELIKHYNCGNLDEVVFNHEASQLPMLKNSNDSQFVRKEDAEMSRRIDDYFKRELIVARNRRMSERILSLLNTNRNESLFFVFGAGHFIGKNSIIDFMLEAGHEITQIASLAPRQLQQRPFTSQRCQQYLKQRNRKLAANALNRLSNTTTPTDSLSTSYSGMVPSPHNSDSFMYNELPPLSAETINTGQNLLPEQRPFPANLFSPASRSQLNKLHQQQQQQHQQASVSSNPFQNLNRFEPYQVKDYSHAQRHQQHHQYEHEHSRYSPTNGGNHQSQSTFEQMPSQSQSSLSSAASQQPPPPPPPPPPSNARHYFVFNQLYVRTYLDEQNYTDIVLNKWPFMPEGASASAPSSSSSSSSSSSPSSSSSSLSSSDSSSVPESSSSYQQQQHHRNSYRLPL